MLFVLVLLSCYVMCSHTYYMVTRAVKEDTDELRKTIRTNFFKSQKKL